MSRSPVDNINPLSDAVGGVGWWVLKPRVASRPSSLDGPDTEVTPSCCTTNPVAPSRSANPARVRSAYPSCRS